MPNRGRGRAPAPKTHRRSRPQSSRQQPVPVYEAVYVALIHGNFHRGNTGNSYAHRRYDDQRPPGAEFRRIPRYVYPR